MVCNGEIFNYQQLIQKYNFTMKTKSDCEVILHMYQKFGIEKTVQELDAEFAFILVDMKKNMGILDKIIRVSIALIIALLCLEP